MDSCVPKKTQLLHQCIITIPIAGRLTHDPPARSLSFFPGGLQPPRFLSQKSPPPLDTAASSFLQSEASKHSSSITGLTPHPAGASVVSEQEPRGGWRPWRRRSPSCTARGSAPAPSGSGSPSTSKVTGSSCRL